jgi:uncharacterized membrane protein YgdD (TMEM256/DUF423 family)
MRSRGIWIIIAGVSGFTAVALGAFGAHLLEAKLPVQMMKTWNTGVLYHLVHTAVIAAIAFAGDKRFYRAAIFFTIGIVLFSFSLYFYTATGVRMLAMITPIGGVSFLIAWVMIAIEGFKKE